ncbi:hypothetical protein CVT25_004190 [Psilocybe cyanescens]|uniref:Tyr recombinase domain-containing protein n=1 Tax=Psilocybe cyanescens TaxID=93625 RepID=A0A409X346_PSICY|nr:hypothetical protein CVT25_004190 [Psilocybe cyanescens]
MEEYEAQIPHVSKEISREGVRSINDDRGTRQDTPETSKESEFAGPTVLAIESAIEDFRRGTLSKQRAIFRIVTALGIRSEDEDEPKLRALGEYTAILDGFQVESDRAVGRGEREPNSTIVTAHAASKRRRGSTQLEGNISGGRSEHDESVDEFLTRISNSNDDGPNDSDGSDESDEDKSDNGHEGRGGYQGQSNKKQRIYESDMPRFTSEAKSRSRRTKRSCNTTRNILDLLQKDSATVKRWIRGAISAPAEFPSSEWDALIKGEAVDLDTVFSALHFLNYPEENVGRIGPTEIHFGRPKPAKRIESSGQWTAAWNLTVKATSFLFPHRYDELRSYGEYMERLFSIKSISIHPRLFKYDDATNSMIITKPSWRQMVWDRKGKVGDCETLQDVRGAQAGDPKSVTVSTQLGGASSERNASSSTSASPANNVDMENWTARSLRESEIVGRRPKYLRHNIFRDDGLVSRSTAEWTLSAMPLPQPAPAEINNPIVNKTIEENPDLFEVCTPINVDQFERLLKRHPNRPFVVSVVESLRNGFWPWADTHIGKYPDIWDGSLPPPDDDAKREFLRNLRDIEIGMGRFSKAFGPDLLPGMYSSPTYQIPKAGSSEFRLVTDHSAGPFSLNSMIPRKDIAGYPLDNITHLGEMLRDIKRKYPNEDIVLWKSDISEAYRNLPVHKASGKGSGSDFIAVNASVTWGAKYERNIEWIATYCDDSFGPERASKMLFYAPYNKYMPRNQVKLLQLWDEIGLPHKEKKQISGSIIDIIGFEVDANLMTITLPSHLKRELCDHLKSVARNPKDLKCPVKLMPREFQQLAGWFNWALNVFPLLRPALCNIYAKMPHANPDKPYTKLYVNNLIRADLTWAIDHMEVLSGVRVLDSSDWELEDADVHAICDASLTGMGFWFPEYDIGYACQTLENLAGKNIFYYEALCVLCALLKSDIIVPEAMRVVLYTDSFNTVQIFNSMAALPEYNEILKMAVNHVLKNANGNESPAQVDLRVVHIPGRKNIVADALSRGLFYVAIDEVPSLRIHDFSPPRNAETAGGQGVMIVSGVRSRQPKREPWSYERLLHERARALGQSIDTSTWKMYGSALNSYLNFVRMHDLPVNPTPETLSFFTVYQSHQIKPDSVDTYLSGICQQLEPYFPEVRTARKSMLVKRTLDGCKRLRGVPTNRKRALTMDDLNIVADAYSHSPSHDDRLFLSMLLTGFFALMRLGELAVPDDPTLFNPMKISKRRNVIIIQKHSQTIDPHFHFKSYLRSRDSLHPFSSALWLRADGSIPSRSFFISRLRKFFDSDVAGQSMRSGGATSLAESGVPPHLIQAIGRWASEAFKIYIRKNPVLMQALLFGRAAHERNPLS